MIDLEQRCRNLEKLLHKEVPLSDSIGMAVHSYDGKQLELLYIKLLIYLE